MFTFALVKQNNGAIAQLVEQRTENPCVPGSIPGGTTENQAVTIICDCFLFLWQMSLFVLHTKMQNRIKFDYRERRRSGLIVSYC